MSEPGSRKMQFPLPASLKHTGWWKKEYFALCFKHLHRPYWALAVETAINDKIQQGRKKKYTTVKSKRSFRRELEKTADWWYARMMENPDRFGLPEMGEDPDDHAYYRRRGRQERRAKYLLKISESGVSVRSANDLDFI
jgi:hypothetical protein